MSAPNPCWKWVHDADTPGASTGASALVASPSQDGQARNFVTTWTGSGGERYSNYFGTNNLDLTSTVWQYDTWVYFTDLTTIHAIELDINQTLSNGNTVIYGTQCNLDQSGGIWQYTTALNPTTSQWLNSTIPCTRAQFTANTWHHIILNSHRDAVGTVTYDSVVFDGTSTSFGGLGGNSAFTLGFIPLGNIVINFQIDGNGAGGTTGYLDLTTVNRY